MNKRVILKATAISGAAVLLLGTAPLTATATLPGLNGRIVFQRWDEAGFAQVWTANPDLTAQQQLTHGDRNSGWAAWAPDASRIAIDTDRADPDLTDNVVINDVYTMRPDGTDLTKLTDSVGFSGDPAYSPDGSLIAFDADRGVPGGLSIYVVKPDGTGMRRVTTPPSGSIDSEPRFSPDGRKLVFTRYQGGRQLKSGRAAAEISAMFSVNVDGTRPQRLSGWGWHVGQADWSPDGTRIVFEQQCCRLADAGIYTVDVQSGKLTRIVDGHGVTGIGNDQALQIDGYYDPVFSPDGTKIIAGREFLDNDGNFMAGFVLVNADGTNLHWAASTVREEHQPDWGTAPLQ